MSLMVGSILVMVVRYWYCAVVGTEDKVVGRIRAAIVKSHEGKLKAMARAKSVTITPIPLKEAEKQVTVRRSISPAKEEGVEKSLENLDRLTCSSVQMHSMNKKKYIQHMRKVDHLV